MTAQFIYKQAATVKPQNLDDFLMASRRIYYTEPRNLAKFSPENCGL